MPTFYDYARYNSGTHFLDSGGAYGRHHEQPAIKRIDPYVTWDNPDDCAYIETANFLDRHLEIDDDMMKMFDAFAENHPDEPWFELSTMFLEKMGFTQHVRDNTYNNENTLTQEYVWEVWTDDPNESDWIYPSGKHVTVIFIHTGCDVRGGYSPPIFCTGRGEYPIPVDLCAQYYIECRTQEFESYNQDLSCGYSSWPHGQLEDIVDRWLPYVGDGSSFGAIIDGCACIVHAEPPCEE